MKFSTSILFVALILFSTVAMANAIDDNCPQHTYKSAPVVVADKFICHTGYAIAYSYKTKTAIYTTNFLGGVYTEFERGNQFKNDPNISIEYSASNSDYKNSLCNNERCDRGHLVSFEDLSTCEVCVEESFYLSNIVPQDKNNNRGIWKSLESRVRKYSMLRNPVYVVSGTIFNKNHKVIGDNVGVPDKLFKIVIDSKSGESISFIIENKPIPSGDLNGKVVSIKTIEGLTGIVFDNSLNKTKNSSYQYWFSR